MSVISIHAPHAGSDAKNQRRCPRNTISIHAPHAGSDAEAGRAPGECLYFNPRSPCGERRQDVTTEMTDSGFQSTLPKRGATEVQSPYLQSDEISIHAPHAGSDQFVFHRFFSEQNFNPRSPCGERHLQRIIGASFRQFQSTLPMRGATCNLVCVAYHGLGFQSTLPMRGATGLSLEGVTRNVISIHAPHAGSDSN